ncbi:MAG: hypothetical protein ACI82G_002855, partial [Bradymonadia bacterium]
TVKQTREPRVSPHPVAIVSPLQADCNVAVLKSEKIGTLRSKTAKTPSPSLAKSTNATVKMPSYNERSVGIECDYETV